MENTKLWQDGGERGSEMEEMVIDNNKMSAQFACPRTSPFAPPTHGEHK